jgi:hypothetical protein
LPPRVVARVGKIAVGRQLAPLTDAPVDEEREIIPSLAERATALRQHNHVFPGRTWEYDAFCVDRLHLRLALRFQLSNGTRKFRFLLPSMTFHLRLQ